MRKSMLRYDSPNDISIASLLERAKNLSPNNPAITVNDKTYTWDELYNRASSLAAWLDNKNITKVAYKGLNSIEFVDLIFACSFIGAICIPINVRLNEEETAVILKDCDPYFLPTITESMYNVVEHNKFAPGTNEDLLTIVYTTGSTGLPKGVMATHRGYYINALTTSFMHGLDVGDATIITMPLFHMGAINRLFIGTFLRSHMILMERFEPVDFMKSVEKYKVKNVTFIPTMAEMLFDRKDFFDYDMSSLENIQFGGTKSTNTFKEKLQKNFPKAKLVETYAMTEATGNILSNGVLSPHLDAKIVDSEFVVRGPTVTPGYWNSDSSNLFTEDGWLRTGDCAEQHDDKFVITGRKKEIIISGGVNIYPAEIEEVLQSHPGVQRVSVVDTPSEKWGDIVTAYVIGNVSESELDTLCRKSLAAYKAPKRYVFVDNFPLKENGKVDKLALKML